jgi:uncharacterized protein
LGPGIIAPPRDDIVLIPISDHPLGATFAIRVQPRAARTSITGTVGEALKISVSAPPLDGRANVAVVEFFSEVLSVPRSAVQVVAGERSRNKVVRIAGCSSAEVQRRLREHFTV